MALRALAACVLLAGVAVGGCGDEGELTLRYSVAKPCVRPGEQQTVTTHTRSDVELAYAVVYPDGNFRGEAPRGRSDKHGTFKQAWTVPADVPGGSVKVRILAVKGRESANVTAPFRVGSAKAPCS